MGAGIAGYQDGRLAGKHSYHLPEHATVFQDELVGQEVRRSSLMALLNPKTYGSEGISSVREEAERWSSG